MFGIEKNEVLMVGDNYDIDILVGINVGMYMFFVYIGVIIVEKLIEYEV